MKIHTTVGVEILSRVDFPYPVLPIVRHHHEQWNGKGYPDGLKGDQIPVTARVISVVDSFDSVREDRPFRRGMTRDEAIALLLRGAGTHFDPKIVSLFINNLEEFESQIAVLGLEQPGQASAGKGSLRLKESDFSGGVLPRGEMEVYDQIKNANREVYSLYEIARTFGSSLDVEDTVSILVNKVGHLVPFDTCVVYLFDELKAYATAAHVAGKNAEALRGRCIAPGEGVTGFALANRRSINRIDPGLDFNGVELTKDSDYRSMASLPLIKDERLLGALSLYSMEVNEYTDDHIRMLETITRLASDALYNSMHHAEAESNALTDPLTGLPNARAMYLRFEQEASRSRRTRQAFQVIMLDLDEFKQVNDTFGHKVGDQVLREIGRILQLQLREYDFLARYAGDEFVAILQDMTSDQVDEMRERIERAIAAFTIRVRSDKQVRVGVSIGSATFGLQGETLDQLLLSADQAMYQDKSAHKARRRREFNEESGSVVEVNADKALASSSAVN
jgi:diguanylate cyclase (GGDEF)-like protein